MDTGIELYSGESDFYGLIGRPNITVVQPTSKEIKIHFNDEEEVKYNPNSDANSEFYNKEKHMENNVNTKQESLKENDNIINTKDILSAYVKEFTGSLASPPKQQKQTAPVVQNNYYANGIPEIINGSIYSSQLFQNITGQNGLDAKNFQPLDTKKVLNAITSESLPIPLYNQTNLSNNFNMGLPVLFNNLANPTSTINSAFFMSQLSPQNTQPVTTNHMTPQPMIQTPLQVMTGSQIPSSQQNDLMFANQHSTLSPSQIKEEMSEKSEQTDDEVSKPKEKKKRGRKKMEVSVVTGDGDTLLAPVSDTEGKGTVECPICGVMYSKYYYNLKHRFFHSGKKYDCSVCGRSFNHQHNMYRHKRVHEDINDYEYYCNEEGCEMVFKTHTGLKRHTQMKHNGLPCGEGKLNHEKPAHFNREGKPIKKGRKKNKKGSSDNKQNPENFGVSSPATSVSTGSHELSSSPHVQTMMDGLNQQLYTGQNNFIPFQLHPQTTLSVPQPGYNNNNNNKTYENMKFPVVSTNTSSNGQTVIRPIPMKESFNLNYVTSQGQTVLMNSLPTMQLQTGSYQTQPGNQPSYGNNENQNIKQEPLYPDFQTGGGVNLQAPATDSGHFKTEQTTKSNNGNKNTSVTCHICEKDFSVHYIREHLDHHAGRSYTCFICGSTFSSRDKLKRHRRQHTNVNDYDPYCGECKLYFDSTKKLAFHVRKVHQQIENGLNSRYRCLHCNRIFRSKRSRDKHELTHKKDEQISSTDNQQMNNQQLPSNEYSNDIASKAGDYGQFEENPCHFNQSSFENDNSGYLNSNYLNYIQKFTTGDGSMDKVSDITHSAPSYDDNICNFSNVVK